MDAVAQSVQRRSARLTPGVVPLCSFVVVSLITPLLNPGPALRRFSLNAKKDVEPGKTSPEGQSSTKPGGEAKEACGPVVEVSSMCHGSGVTVASR